MTKEEFEAKARARVESITTTRMPAFQRRDEVIGACVEAFDFRMEPEYRKIIEYGDDALYIGAHLDKVFEISYRIQKGRYVDVKVTFNYKNTSDLERIFKDIFDMRDEKKDSLISFLMIEFNMSKESASIFADTYLRI